MPNFGLNPHISEKFKNRINVLKIPEFFYQKFQLFVKNLSKACVVCQKIATSCHAYYFF